MPVKYGDSKFARFTHSASAGLRKMHRSLERMFEGPLPAPDTRPSIPTPLLVESTGPVIWEHGKVSSAIAVLVSSPMIPESGLHSIQATQCWYSVIDLNEESISMERTGTTKLQRGANNRARPGYRSHSAPVSPGPISAIPRARVAEPKAVTSVSKVVSKDTRYYGSSGAFEDPSLSASEQAMFADFSDIQIAPYRVANYRSISSRPSSCGYRRLTSLSGHTRAAIWPLALSHDHERESAC